MKSGAEVLLAGVRVEGKLLIAPFLFPLPVGAGLCFVGAFFFDTPAVGVLAGAFLARVFLSLAMA
jgi:hypothetical protein